MAEPIDERKLATVLFADLVGSTELASDQDPERTRTRLERFYPAWRPRSRPPAEPSRSSPPPPS